jgi:hypothetical protein
LIRVHVFLLLDHSKKLPYQPTSYKNSMQNLSPKLKCTRISNLWIYDMVLTKISTSKNIKCLQSHTLEWSIGFKTKSTNLCIESHLVVSNLTSCPSFKNCHIWSSKTIRATMKFCTNQVDKKIMFWYEPHKVSKFSKTTTFEALEMDSQILKSWTNYMMFLHQPLHIKFILWYQPYIVSKFFKTTTFEVLELDLQNLKEPTMTLL